MYGFIRVAAATPQVRVADCNFNAAEVCALISEAASAGVQAVCFPELCLTGYTCADLFFTQRLQRDAWAALEQICRYTASMSLIAIVGLPLPVGGKLYNVAAIIESGRVQGFVPKTHIPNNAEFYEKRWFASGRTASETTVRFMNADVPFGTDLLFRTSHCTFGVEICEDLWSPIPPSCQLAMHGAELLFNLSASNEAIGKNAYRRQLVCQQSARCHAGYVYASAGAGESTTDLVFGGSAFIAENGTLLAEGERFVEKSRLLVHEIDVERLAAERMRNTNFFADRQGVCRTVETEMPELPADEPLRRTFGREPFVPCEADRQQSCNEIFSIQLAGLSKRWRHTQAQTVVIGISGGLDSTLALLVCVKTADALGYDRKRVVGITMPGFGTTGRTYRNAVNLMQSLGITCREISIKEACLQHFEAIGHDPTQHDVTYENTQARERTQILMDVANQQNGLVVGTGDLSELALGWATYNGDQMSMYGVNAGVPKTLVRYLVQTAATQLDDASRHILFDILDTPVSPELLPADDKGNIAQKTEDLVGPYELHDFFLYYFIRFGFTPEKIFFLSRQAFAGVYTDELIGKWLRTFMRRFYQQQFKRSCMPDGPKVGSINLSPRGDWRMPSDACLPDIRL